MPDFTRPWCFYVDETMFDEGKGFVPSLVFDNEPGHYPLRGSQPDECPYYWGMTIAEARAACSAANEARGIDEARTREIVASSMRAHFAASR